MSAGERLSMFEKNKGLEQQCSVCFKKFELKKENVYRATETTGIVNMFVGEKTYDATDCPFCSCQNILGERLRKIAKRNEPQEIENTGRVDG